MIQKEINTGMTLNNLAFQNIIKGPNILIPSANSAFSAHRKRVREDSGDEELYTYKRFKAEEEPTTSWDATITSKSSSSSFSMSHRDQIEVCKQKKETKEEVKAPQDEVLKTKTLEFTPYKHLEIKTRHEFFLQSLKTIGNQ